MIDWLGFAVRGVMHRPYAGELITATDTTTGQINWQARKSKPLTGSARDSVMVKSSDVDHDGYANTLTISGNPAKLLQGHNLYGSDDLPALVYEVAARAMVAGLHEWHAEQLTQPDSCELAAILHTLAHAIGSRPQSREAPRTLSKSWKGSTTAPVAQLPGQSVTDMDSPHVVLHHVDINYMANLGTDHDAQLWLATAARFATFAARPARLSRESTVYFGSVKSERVRLKFYAKGPELAANPPRALRNVADEQQPLAFRSMPLLASHAAGRLRAEAGLHRKALTEQGLRYACDWNALTARRVWLATMETFDMPQPSDTLNTSELPTRIALALHAWRCGEDLKARYSRRQWYRIRSELRELVGVDIADPCSDPVALELPAMQLPARAWPRNVVEMFPADDEPAPAAMVAAGLYFEPRTDWRIADRPAPALTPMARPAYCPWPRDPADHREQAA